MRDGWRRQAEPSDGEVEPSTATLFDQEGFGRLYEQAAPRLYGYIARRLGPDLGEELTAEVFVRAWEGRDRFDASLGDPFGWLFGIATNLIRRHHRSTDRQSRAYARLPVDRAGMDHGDAVPAQLDAQHDLDSVLHGLERLSQMDRDLILLRAWADLSYAQIAEAMGLSQAVVKSRLNRARARLQVAGRENAK